VSYDDAARRLLDQMSATGQTPPGFGHRQHMRDPRAARLMQLAFELELEGGHTQLARAIEQELIERRAASGLPAVSLNADGAIAAVAGDLGLDAETATMLFTIARDGVANVTWDFLTSFPSRKPELAGAKAALLGTLWVMGFTSLFSIPLGVGAAIYLEEFAPRNLLTRVIEINISTLAGVPSVVYGLLGLALFVYGAGMGPSILAAATIAGEE